MAATARLEYRLDQDERARIERAAELSGEPPTVFAREAAMEKADRVLLEHERTTVLPAEFFDLLMDAMDEPEKPNRKLAAAAKRLNKTVVRH